MKIAEAWLREWINPAITREALMSQLTMAGLEIEGCEEVGGDFTFEVKVTPNRGDCLSVLGLAREIALINHADLHAPTIPTITPTTNHTFPVKVEAPVECPRYIGRMIRGIHPAAISPAWLQQKLQSCGINPISPVVDVTNYVLLELGQPLHAFDADKLSGGLVIRKAQAWERLTLLNAQSIELSPDMLVIADKNQPQALAGIMGGLDSSVTLPTENIFLESAFFAPLAIINRARRYNLNTNSSYRFERGVDPNLQRKAIERATALLLEIVGGEAGPLIEVSSEKNLPQCPSILLRRSRIQKLLGISMSDTLVEKILHGLQMQITPHKEGWSVKAPSYRFDISIEADIIEELARIHGYHEIPVALPTAQQTFLPASEQQLSLTKARKILIDRSYHEVITYSFVDPKMQQQCDPHTPPIRLLNPISSDLAVMRTQLWPGLISALQYNQNRQQPCIRFFETGLRFIQTSEALKQEKVLSGITSGLSVPEQWSIPKRALDFYDIKADLEALFSLTHEPESFTFTRTDHPALHPEQSSQILRHGKPVGLLGRLHPAIEQSLSLTGNTYVFELLWDVLSPTRLPHYQPISKFPAVRRDIAFFVDAHITYDQLSVVVHQTAGEILHHLLIFDLYQGKGVPEGQKSVALGLTLQHTERTLIDSEVNDLINSIISALKKTYHVSVRG